MIDEKSLEWEAIKEDYAKPNSMVDIGNMYYWANYWHEQYRASLPSAQPKSIVCACDCDGGVDWSSGSAKVCNQCEGSGEYSITNPASAQPSAMTEDDEVERHWHLANIMEIADYEMRETVEEIIFTDFALNKHPEETAKTIVNAIKKQAALTTQQAATDAEEIEWHRKHSFELGFEACELTYKGVVDAARETIEDNLHLADGDNCTLYKLKTALAAIEQQNAIIEEKE